MLNFDLTEDRKVGMEDEKGDNEWETLQVWGLGKHTDAHKHDRTHTQACIEGFSLEL